MTVDKSPKFPFLRHRANGLWLSVAVLSLLVQAAGWGDDWQYDRLRIAGGEYWLLLSGHLAHLNWSHWALNMAGLAIVAVFFGGYASWREWLLVMLVSMLVISTGIYRLQPGIHSYVGLSGVLHGLFVVGAWRECRHYRLSGAVLTGLLVGKLLWEARYGALPGSESLTRGRVLTEAHLYGALAGAGLLGVSGLWRRMQRQAP